MSLSEAFNRSFPLRCKHENKCFATSYFQNMKREQLHMLLIKELARYKP